MAGNSSTLATINTAYRSRVGAPVGGVATFSGNGSTTAFNIAHGYAGTPKPFWALPITEAATAKRTVTANGTNVIVTFATAPPSGTNNVKFRWGASRL